MYVKWITKLALAWAALLIGGCTDQQLDDLLGPRHAVLEASLTNSTNGEDSELEHCGMGELMSALHAFIPGISVVNESGFDEDGLLVWTDENAAGLGGGVARCQFRLFAGSVPHLPDSYTFSEHDLILGGSTHAIPYNLQDVQEHLDLLYPEVRGSYRRKAIAHLSRERVEVLLTRLTYFDEAGDERPIGDTGPEDPTLTDPTAGEARLQQMLVTEFRDFFGGHPSPEQSEGQGNQDRHLVYRQWAFIAQLEPGTYHSVMHRYFDDVFQFEFDPVELVILPSSGEN